jgi:hypothetical protein
VLALLLENWADANDNVNVGVWNLRSRQLVVLGIILGHLWVIIQHSFAVKMNILFVLLAEIDNFGL